MRFLIVGLVALAVGGASQTATTARQGGNWARFGYDAARPVLHDVDLTLPADGTRCA